MTGTDVAIAVEATRNDLFMPMLDQFQDALRGEIDPKSFFQTICVSLERDPTLMHRCTKQSLVTAAMTAAIVRLPVDGFSGQGHLIRFRDRAQFVPGYKGVITCAGRSLFSVRNELVREADSFEFRPLHATEPIVHRFNPKLPPKDRGKVIGAYAVYLSKVMPPIAKWMQLSEIFDIRDKAPGYKAKPNESLWKLNPNVMIKKTPIRAGGNLVPYELAPDLHRVLGLETQAHELGRNAWLEADGIIRAEDPAIGRDDPPAIASALAARFEIVLSDGSIRTYPTIEKWRASALTTIDKIKAKGTADDLAQFFERNAHTFSGLESDHAADVAAVMAGKGDDG